MSRTFKTPYGLSEPRFSCLQFQFTSPPATLPGSPSVADIFSENLQQIFPGCSLDFIADAFENSLLVPRKSVVCTSRSLLASLKTRWRSPSENLLLVAGMTPGGQQSRACGSSEMTYSPSLEGKPFKPLQGLSPLPRSLRRVQGRVERESIQAAYVATAAEQLNLFFLPTFRDTACA